MILDCLRIGLISALLLMLILSIVGLVTEVNDGLYLHRNYLKELYETTNY
jgi:hypothetical protein